MDKLRDPALPRCTVVMAKRPVPGRVKTRLIGELTGLQVACVHAAMLECVLDRLRKTLTGRVVLALDGDIDKPLMGSDAGLSVAIPAGVEIIDQGTGDLGERIGHVWQTLGSGEAVFFGVDSPDVPTQVLTIIYDSLNNAHAAVGPVEDGGYWCLAARRNTPELLAGIDWGTSAVYHQTREAARNAGLTLRELPAWHDVDTAEDLSALLTRLRDAREPALTRLKQRLDKITQDHQP
jgi:rSAM/selenodomain-associated transferase 1